MNFVKMQGTGNDFVLVDARGIKRDWPALARQMSHRHFGVGSDGLLLLMSSQKTDFCLRMFNPDGSEAEACGNGLRCFGKYLAASGLSSSPEIKVETPAGIKILRPLGERGVQVAMGAPRLAPAEIPMIVNGRPSTDSGPVLDYEILAGNRALRVNSVSMGNPHAVCFLEQPVPDFPLADIGPKVEHHPAFPNRVNFEIVNVISRREVRARVWERGAGETLSCGTGACAIAVASKLKGLCDMPLAVTLPGGTLTIDWDGQGAVSLTGPAEIVFTGEWPG